jgi:phosphoribosyl 1,2-cyclic phosphodiesterase
MRITFWGTRGSLPSPGKQTVRYGGNTPCIEVRLDDNRLMILDAGTGIHNLGNELLEKGERLDTYLFISHPHLDHIQGFPFFAPIYKDGHEVTIVGVETEKVTLRKMITDLMNKVYFPIHMDELKAKINFRKVGEEEFTVYNATIKTIFVNHPTFSLGYRFTHNGKSFAYISDNEPFDRSNNFMKNGIEPWILEKYLGTPGDPNQRIYDFVQNADVLIHDATYTPEEYRKHVGWGHSHYLFPLEVAARGNVRKLVLFHHNPSHSDDKVDEILQKCKHEIRSRQYAFECVAAAEGMILNI